MLVKVSESSTNSSDETFQAGRRFALTLTGNEVIALFGDLGSGKTTFLKGLISGLTNSHPDQITSPTFNYLNIYPGDVPVYHFDLYRLKNGEEFTKAGFFEYLQGDGICCLEWADRIGDQLPEKTIRITLKYNGMNQRTITIA
jgi:tRNA threonylcarbamoyladenosine biosynthesis protein TsaE